MNIEPSLPGLDDYKPDNRWKRWEVTDLLLYTMMGATVPDLARMTMFAGFRTERAIASKLYRMGINPAKLRWQITRYSV